MVSLTGSIDTGQKVLQAASATIKRTHLELGGKAPVIVFDDADLGSVVAGVKAFGYYNAGQDCTAACRIYAGKKIYDNLVADLSSAVKEHQIQSAGRRRKRNRTVDLVQPAKAACKASSSERARKEAHVHHRRRQIARRQGLLLRADSRSPALIRTTRSCAKRCSVPSCRSPASTTSTRPSRGPMTATMGSLPRCGPRTSARAWRRRRGFTMAAPGSTPTSCW